MKKRNLLKRNSGFLIGCVVAAGASFFTADAVMSDQILLRLQSTEPSTETEPQRQLDSEKVTERTYETDPFTVTAAGKIVKGVETESQKKKEPETDENGNPISTPQTDENGNVIDTPQTDENGNVIDTPQQTDENGNVIGVSQPDGSGSSGSGETVYDGGNYSDDGSYGSGESSYTGGESSYSGGSSGGQSVEIIDSGNGSYYYDNGSGGSGSGSGNNGGGSSSGGSTGGGSDSGATTPDDVILWGISSRYIDESELYNYSSGQLRLIRNEIFALHGRIFRSQDLAEYFSQKSWYVPTYDPDDFDANMFDYLNDYEEANLKVILNYEAALAGN